MPQIQPPPVAYDDIDYRAGGENSIKTEAPHVREFSVNGKSYRACLSDAHAKEFDDDFGPEGHYTQFADVIDRPGRTRAARSSTGSSPRTSRTLTAEIRGWAESQNFQPPVSKKGRISDKHKEAFFSTFPDKRPKD